MFIYPILLLKGENLNFVDQSEVRVTVGNRPCNISSYTDSEILCVPPQSGSGNANVMVCKTVFLTKLYIM